MPQMEDRRDQIFSEGARVFAEKGYGRTSLQEVADALGVTRPALYYYYRSKEDLLFEITSFVMDRVMADLREVAESGRTPLEKLRGLIGRYVRFFASHPHELTIMSTEVDSLGPQRREVILARQREYLRLVRSIVRDLLGEHPGTTLDETSVAFALLGGMNWIFKWYDPGGRVTPEKLADDFTQLFSFGLQGPPPGEE
jgi:TetR/AcrR family transcriptional regulator, cholesterol catabolism regulator